MSFNELTYKEALEVARSLLAKADLPLPEKPEGFGETYRFPMDPSTQTGVQLARLTMQLAAWRGRAAWLVGVAESDLQTLDAVFEVIKGVEMVQAEHELKAKGINRPVKEQIYSHALDSSLVLQQLFRRGLEKRGFLRLMQAQKDIYEQQIWVLHEERRRQGWENRNDREGSR